MTEAGDGPLRVVVVQGQRRPGALGPDVLERIADRPAHRRGVPRREQQVEGEALLELAGSGVLRRDVRPQRRVGLGDHHDVALGVDVVVVVEDGTPAPPDVVALGAEPVGGVELALRERRGVGEGRVLADGPHGVDAEPFDAAVEPEPQGVGEHGVDVRVPMVEVGLVRSEGAQVPLRVVVADGGPHRSAERRLPVVGRTVGPVAEPEAGPLVAARRTGQRGLEPGVLVAAVVGDHVEHDPQPVVAGIHDEPVERLEVAVGRVDVEVVGDVVPVVPLRRGVGGTEPDGVDTE